MKILRHNDDWDIFKFLSGSPYYLNRTAVNHHTADIVKAFHLIARENGSSALWLDHSGILATYDEKEPQMNYPYEEWLQQAIRVGISENTKDTILR